MDAVGVRSLAENCNPPGIADHLNCLFHRRFAANYVWIGLADTFDDAVGALTAGFSLAVMMANSGGAWDNAKKYVEDGAMGGKGSEAHKATVVGDTVGDPFKDTSGPSLNILIKLMSMVSVVFAGLVAATGVGGLLSHLIG